MTGFALLTEAHLETGCSQRSLPILLIISKRHSKSGSPSLPNTLSAWSLGWGCIVPSSRYPALILSSC